MMDELNIPRPEPRLWIRFDNGTWSAFRGAILLASNLLSINEAWDLIERHAAPPPIRTSVSTYPEAGRARRSWRR